MLYESETDPNFENEFPVFLEIVARVALNQPRIEEFVEAIATLAPKLTATSLFSQIPVDEHEKFARFLARSFWNSIPWPDNRFQPKPLPREGRNDRCRCGSGAKYKNCCSHYEQFPLDFPPDMLLPYILDQMPKKELKALSHTQLSAPQRVIAASFWRDSQELDKTALLLEPLFVATDSKAKKLDQAFDLLMDCYSDLGRPRKKQKLLEQALQSKDRALRCTALQRHCTILADQGETEQAWEVFKEAQREMPDDPHLAHLEIVLLLSSNQASRAKERAKFWLARFHRKGSYTPEFIDFFERVVADPMGTFAQTSSKSYHGLDILMEMIQGLQHREPQNLYTVEEGPEDSLIYIPKPKLQKMENEWDKLSNLDELFSVESYSMGDIAVWEPYIVDEWMGFLEDEPNAFNSFFILDGIRRALQSTQDATSPWFAEKVFIPFFEWCHALLKVVHKSSTKMILWMALENRPAIRVMVEYALYLKNTDREEQAREIMEELVYKWNPNDNHGIRFLLTTSYMQAGMDGTMLELATRYPDEAMPEILYSKALAHFRLEQHDEANKALDMAIEKLPKVAKALLAKKLKKPKLRPGYISMGGDDQAWNYREAFGDMWQKECVLKWLRGSVKK